MENFIHALLDGRAMKEQENIVEEDYSFLGCIGVGKTSIYLKMEGFWSAEMNAARLWKEKIIILIFPCEFILTCFLCHLGLTLTKA